MKRTILFALTIIMLFTFASCNEPENDVIVTSETGDAESTTAPATKNENTNTPSETESSGLAYQVNEDGTTCTITGMGDCKDEKLFIPSKIENYTVTGIKNGAFNNCSLIKEVTIPASVIEIDGVIFDGCIHLKKINYFSSHKNALPLYVQYDYDLGFKIVETVEYGAEVLPERFFYDTPRIKNLILNENVKSIGEWVFAAADGVDNLTISASVANISATAFAGLKATSIQVSQGNAVYECKDGCLINKETKELIIGTNVDKIPSDGSVTRIGAYAFTGSQAEAITLPNTITSIGEMAFSYCESLKEITIPSGVISIESKAFCLTNFESIKVDAGNTVYHSDGNCLIETATKTLIAGSEHSVIPTDGSVECIGSAAFYGLHPSNMILPKSVTRVNDYAFYVWNDLESVVFYEGSIADFQKIVFGEHYEFLRWSTIYIYSETTPSTEEYSHYWRYNENGVPSIWETDTGEL